MRFQETEIRGAWVIDVEPIEDQRGLFARVWCRRELAEHGLETEIAQCNTSFSKQRGTLRGMHFQRAPHGEVKFIRCSRGALYDVIIDLRPDSRTYRRWVGVELSVENRRALYVPRGLAHGFQTLEDDVEVFYMMSDFHAPDAEAGVRWNDPAFDIEWPVAEPTDISDKDVSWPDFVG